MTERKRRRRGQVVDPAAGGSPQHQRPSPDLCNTKKQILFYVKRTVYKENFTHDAKLLMTSHPHLHSEGYLIVEVIWVMEVIWTEDQLEQQVIKRVTSAVPVDVTYSEEVTCIEEEAT